MRYLLGIDLGGTNIAAGAVTPEGRLLSKVSLPTLPHRPYRDVIRDMAHALSLAEERAYLSRKDCLGLGVGVPGCVDPTEGTVHFLPNLNWQNIPLGQDLKQLSSLPVFLGNDADCAALGEYVSGAGSAFSSMLMITLGTGVGGGLIVNGNIFSGFHGGGFEPGHLPLVLDGEPCGCGNRGCLEAYASATALIRETERAMLGAPESQLWTLAPTAGQITPKTPFDGAALGDACARGVVERYIHALAAGISGLVNILRPEAVVLGGGVSNQGDALLLPLKKEFLSFCYASAHIRPPLLRVAALGNDAGIIGAGLLARAPRFEGGFCQ